MPGEMRQRLAARGDSWGEFVELLANYRLDDQDRKKAEKNTNMKPIMPPPSLIKQLEKERRKKAEGTA